MWVKAKAEMSSQRQTENPFIANFCIVCILQGRTFPVELQCIEPGIDGMQYLYQSFKCNEVDILFVFTIYLRSPAHMSLCINEHFLTFKHTIKPETNPNIEIFAICLNVYK
jgi:hypothetical protein